MIRSRARRRLLALALLLASLLLAYMVRLASSAPVVRRLDVSLAGWPAGAPAMRIVLLSDLHVSRPGDTPARLAGTVARVDALRPDLVLIAGDFLSTGIVGAHSYGPGTIAHALAGLTPRLGTIAVLGNHDYAAPAAVRRALARARVRVLDNQAVRIGPIAVVGVSDAFSGHADVAAALAAWRRVGGVPVVLTHSPDIVPALPPALALVLAGHTHCGQISLPLIGPPVTQSRYGRRYACGVVREGDRVTIVSAGLGTSTLPIRLGAPPDLWLIRLGPPGPAQ